MKRRVSETKAFAREIADLLSSRKLVWEDYDALRKELAENPDKGNLLAGTGGVRKIRLRSASKGKSGGFRVCYFYDVETETIYLLFAFQKNEQENLTDAQKKLLKRVANELKGKA